MFDKFIGYSQKRASRIFNNILIDDYIVKRNQYPPKRKSCRNCSAGWLFCIIWILPNVLFSAVIAYMYRLQTTLVLTDVYSIKYFRKFNLNTLMQRTEFFVVTALYGLKSPMTSQFFLEICSNFNSRDSQTYYLANYSRKLYENEKMDRKCPAAPKSFNELEIFIETNY